MDYEKNYITKFNKEDKGLTMSLRKMNSKKLTIKVTIVLNQNTSYKTFPNREEETIIEMKIQRVSDHGNNGKQSMMIMVKLRTYVLWH